MSLKFAIPIILILVGLVIWTFVEPYAEHRRQIRAVRKRWATERRPRRAVDAARDPRQAR